MEILGLENFVELTVRASVHTLTTIDHMINWQDVDLFIDISTRYLCITATILPASPQTLVDLMRPTVFVRRSCAIDFWFAFVIVVITIAPVDQRYLF